MRLLYLGAALTAMLLSVGCKPVNLDETPIKEAPIKETEVLKLAHLEELHNIAETLQNDRQVINNSHERIEAAWLDLKNAAEQDFGQTHPLFGLAQIKLASYYYTQGKIPIAIEYAENGIDVLAPVKNNYMATYTEGASVLGVMYGQSGRSNEAEPLLRKVSNEYEIYYRALPTEEKTPSITKSKSNIEFALSQILIRHAKFDEAILFQEKSLQTRRDGLGDNDPDTISSIYGYAQALMKGGQIAQAEIQARLAVEKAKQFLTPQDSQYARSFEMLGIILSRTGRQIEAVEYLTTALDIKRQTVGPENLYFAYGVHNLGTILLELERYDEAETLFLEADKGFRVNQGENSPYALGSYISAGVAALGNGKTKDALTRFNQASSRLNNQDNIDPNMQARILPGHIVSLLASGDIQNAYQRSAEFEKVSLETMAEAALSRQQAKLLLTYTEFKKNKTTKDAMKSSAQDLLNKIQVSQYLSQKGQLSVELKISLEAILNAAIDIGDIDLAINAAELLIRTKFTHSNKLMRQRAAAKSDEFAAVLRAYQDSKAKLAELDANRLSIKIDAAEISQLNKAYTLELTALNKLKDSMNTSYPEWASLEESRALTVSSIQAELENQQGILAIIPSFKDVFVIAITKDRRLAFKAQGSRANYNSLISNIRANLNLGEYKSDLAYQISKNIFTPDILTLFKDATDIEYISAGSFSSLPLAALPKPQTASNSKGMNWLIDDYSISVRPSFKSKKTQFSSRQDVSGFLGIGSPLPFERPQNTSSKNMSKRQDKSETNKLASVQPLGRYFRGGEGQISALSNLPALTNTHAELLGISRALSTEPNLIFTGAKANEHSIKTQDLTAYNVIAFSTHGLVSGDMEGLIEPALVLSPPSQTQTSDDGLLTASEISALKLNADWIILSACNTAAGNQVNTPAYSGLAQAFTYAGAKSLLVSHWPVRDDVASFLTVNTVKNHQAGMSKATALQKAMNDLRTNKDIPESDNPAIWAPFVLIGE